MSRQPHLSAEELRSQIARAEYQVGWWTISKVPQMVTQWSAHLAALQRQLAANTRKRQTPHI